MRMGSNHAHERPDTSPGLCNSHGPQLTLAIFSQSALSSSPRFSLPQTPTQPPHGRPRYPTSSTHSTHPSICTTRHRHRRTSTSLSARSSVLSSCAPFPRAPFSSRRHSTPSSTPRRGAVARTGRSPTAAPAPRCRDATWPNASAYWTLVSTRRRPVGTATGTTATGQGTPWFAP